MRRFCAVLLAASLGCAGRGLAESDVFSRDRLHEVRVTLPAEEWTALRSEHPDFVSQLGPARTNGRPARVYADHRAVLELDGDRIGEVSVRKKGFIGSVSRVRPSLNLGFGAFGNPRRPAGLAKLAVNNNQQDPSAVHQCIAYDLFRAAGIAAPRASLAHVVVNDEDLGVYTLVEPVDRVFTGREFGPGGALWEGTLTDFREDWLRMFEPKAGTGRRDGAALAGVASALANPDSAGALDAVGTHVDLDLFLTFWAMEVMVGHWDGYANNRNNFFVHRRESDDRLVFVPWGADACLQGGGGFVPKGAPPGVWATGLLARRLYADPEWRGRYRARMRQLLDTVWREGPLEAEIARLDALVGTNAWPGMAGHRAAVRRARDFVRGRRRQLTAVLDAPAKDWTPPPRELSFLREWGTIRADFATTYRRALPVDWFTNGTVALDIRLDGETRPFVRAGVASGPGFDPRQTNEAWVVLVAMRGFGGMQVPAVSVPRARFVAGSRTPVGFFDGSAFLFEGIPAAPSETAFGLLDGMLQLDEAAAAEGAPVKGRLEAKVWKWNF